MRSRLKESCISLLISWMAANCSHTWEKSRDLVSIERNYMLQKLFVLLKHYIMRTSSTEISNQKMFCLMPKVISESLISVFLNKVSNKQIKLIVSVVLLNTWPQRSSRVQVILGELTGGVLEPFYMKCYVDVPLTITETVNKCLEI